MRAEHRLEETGCALGCVRLLGELEGHILCTESPYLLGRTKWRVAPVGKTVKD